MGIAHSRTVTKLSERISFEDLAEELFNAKYVVALTGAGMSEESGIPTFRDPANGIWKKHSIAACATIWGFWRTPEKLWELIVDFLKHNYPVPNPGHISLVDLETLCPLKAVVTQNVDNLHQEAGSSRVIEFHGNLMTSHCYKCKKEFEVSKDIIRDKWFANSLPPKCTYCGGHVKPDVILFGETIPKEIAGAATEEAERCDLMLIIGTSALVNPAANLPKIAAKNNAKIIEVNIDTTELTDNVSDMIVLGKASELSRTVQTLRKLKAS